MRRLCTIPILFLLTTAAPTVATAGPPSQLYGKSVSFRWMDDIDAKDVDGRAGHFVHSHAVGWYISSRGRVFKQSANVRMGGGPSGGKARGRVSTVGVGFSRDPEGGEINTGNRRYRGMDEFKGHTLTITQVFESGARRITVNFDESFHTCTVDVVDGKENGAPGIVAHALNGRLTLATHKVSGQKLHDY